MPTSFLERDVKEMGYGLSLSDDTAIRGLAHKYGVSLQALSIRLANLGLIDATTLG